AGKRYCANHVDGVFSRRLSGRLHRSEPLVKWPGKTAKRDVFSSASPLLAMVLHVYDLKHLIRSFASVGSSDNDGFAMALSRWSPRWIARCTQYLKARVFSGIPANTRSRSTNHNRGPPYES